MAGGVYLYRIHFGGHSRNETVISCAYRPEDVLGANVGMVCVRAVKVID
jgi:hypothetical protein